MKQNQIQQNLITIIKYLSALRLKTTAKKMQTNQTRRTRRTENHH